MSLKKLFSLISVSGVVILGSSAYACDWTGYQGAQRLVTANGDPACCPQGTFKYLKGSSWICFARPQTQVNCKQGQTPVRSGAYENLCFQKIKVACKESSQHKSLCFQEAYSFGTME
jgi:hypothetical protein